MKPSSPEFRLVAWLSALFLVIVGAKLWAVHLYGSQLPFWDQWVEADQFLRPWAEGKLTWSAWFAPHNEHRILFTRLLDVSIIWLNGRWDPLLQMTINAFVHAGFACALAYCLWVFLGKRYEWLICFLLAPFFALPYAAENTLRGFHSQQYFLSLGSLAAIVGLGFSKPGSRWWWFGLVSAVASLFTMASGFLSSLAVVGLIVLRGLRTRQWDRGGIVTLVCAVAIVCAGLALSVTVPEHERFRVTSVFQFLSTLAVYLSWPFMNVPILVFLIALPLVLVAVLYFRSGFKDLSAAEFLLTFALWGVLQAGSLAYGRANYEENQASRYMDVLNVFAIASVFAGVLLAERPPASQMPPWVNRVLPVFCACIVFVGILQVSNWMVTAFMRQCRKVSLIGEENVTQFAATGNPELLLDEPAPRPDPRLVLQVLNHPALAPIFPPICRPPEVTAQPGWLSRAAAWSLRSSRAILSASLILWICLCGFNLARHGRNPGCIAALLAGLVALGVIGSKRKLTREDIAAGLHEELAAQFSSAGYTRRATYHADAATRLRMDHRGGPENPSRRN
jgi:hypothetical protein